MLGETLGVISDLGRLRDIAGVLIRHGLGDFLQRSGIRAVLEKAGAKLHWKALESIADLSTAERVRRALEELGPTFVKLGQLLASRPDLLPPDWVEELGRLHARVTPLEFEQLLPQLIEDLGVHPDEAFASFDREPLAAGSIAQVHAATSKDGADIVVKIRRPGIGKKIDADLRLMARLARALDDEGSELRRYRPRMIARDFARTMRAELDFGVEARNMQTVARNLAGQAELVVPEVDSRFVRARLLVMTRLRGLSAADWLAGDRSGDFDARLVAQVGADAVLQMVFGDGLYHADPHPGNLMFLSDGRLGLLDFGQVGHLSESRRRDLLQFLGSVVDRDEERAVDVLLSWSGDGEPDIDALTADVRAFVDRYYGVELHDMDVRRLLFDVSEIVRENDLALPADVALLIKVFVTLEGLGCALDPSFKFSERIEPAARELRRQLTSPRAVLRRGARDIRSILLQLPSDLRGLMTRARRGDLRVEMDLKRLERFGRQMTQSANRMTVGMITAALIVGTSIAMTIDRGPTIFGIPALGLIGFVLSAAIGVGLLWSIARNSA